MLTVSYKQEANIGRTRSFVDPSFHPDVLPTQILSLYNNDPSLPPFSPVITPTATRGLCHFKRKQMLNSFTFVGFGFVLHSHISLHDFDFSQLM